MRQPRKSHQGLELLGWQAQQLVTTGANLEHQVIGAAWSIAVAAVPQGDKRQILAVKCKSVVEHPKVRPLPDSIALPCAEPSRQLFAVCEYARRQSRAQPVIPLDPIRPGMLNGGHAKMLAR